MYKDGFAVHTHTTTTEAKCPGNTGVSRPKATKAFVLFPSAGKLSIPLRGLLTLLMERAWRFGLRYTIDTDTELADLADLSRSTIAGYLTRLREAGFIQSTIVNGRRRIYPVDKHGNPTMPPELGTGARPSRRARAPMQGGAHAGVATIGDPAHVVVVRERDLNDPLGPPPERPRLALPAPTLAAVLPMAIAEQPAPAMPCVAIAATVQGPPLVAQASAAEPAAQGPAAVQPVEVEPQVTPRVVSWAGLVAPKAEAPKSPEQRLRAALSQAACAALDALPAAQRAKMIREFGSGAMTPTSISYYERKLTMPVAAGQVPIPERAPTAELIRRLPGCGDGALPKMVTERLVVEFGGALDRALWTQIDLLMTAAWLGTVNAEALAFAYEKAMAKKVCEKRGAYFWRVVRDKTGIRGEDLKRLAAGGRS